MNITMSVKVSSFSESCTVQPAGSRILYQILNTPKWTLYVQAEIAVEG